MNKELAQTIVNLIDVVAARGAFKGEELMNVGIIRSNLVSILETPEVVPHDDSAEAQNWVDGDTA